MKIKFTTLTVAVLLTARAGVAQETTTTTTTTTTTQEAHVWNDPNQWWANHWSYAPGDLYTANELSLDFFGSYLAGEHKIENIFHNTIRNGFWGGGVGVNYFFLRNLGVSGDMEIPDRDPGHFVNNFDGSLVARFPIANSGLSPYVFGGGGRQSTPRWEFSGHAGVGMEYRFNPEMGFFGDARYMWVRTTPDEIMFRAGVRFVF